MTVSETIQALQKLPKDLKVVFDCRHCGHALELVEATTVVVIGTIDKSEKAES